MESKHIEAVKKPWRRSSCFEALAQMITTNQRMNKMKAARARFAAQGMMAGTTLSYTAFVRQGGRPVPPPLQAEDDNNNNPRSTSARCSPSVQLAVTPGECY
jgi:hypothetical protein